MTFESMNVIFFQGLKAFPKGHVFKAIIIEIDNNFNHFNSECDIHSVMNNHRYRASLSSSVKKVVKIDR